MVIYYLDSTLWLVKKLLLLNSCVIPKMNICSYMKELLKNILFIAISAGWGQFSLYTPAKDINADRKIQLC